MENNTKFTALKKQAKLKKMVFSILSRLVVKIIDTRFVHLLRIRKGFGGTLFHSRSYIQRIKNNLEFDPCE